MKDINLLKLRENILLGNFWRAIAYYPHINISDFEIGIKYIPSTMSKCTGCALQSLNQLELEQAIKFKIYNR